MGAHKCVTQRVMYNHTCVRARRVGRVEGVGGDVEVVARVVEHHQRDDEAAQHVDHFEACSGSRRRLSCHAANCRSGFSPTQETGRVSGYSERPLGFGAGLATNV